MVKKDVKAWVIKTERELSMGYKNAKEVAFLLLLAVYFGDKQQGLLKVFEPSMEWEPKNVGHSSDTEDGRDAGTGASNTDKMWCCANESVVQEEPERKHTIAKNPKCEVCDKVLNSHARLQRHLATHAEKKSHVCQCCSATSTRKCSVYKHFFTHTREKRHGCPTCGKMFASKWIVIRHLRVHTGEKPFSCDSCPAKFSLKQTLARHQLTHSGKKPWQCDLCQKTFKHKFDLRRHSRVHTGERPYECNLCPATFYSKSCVNRHMRTHTGEKPYECGVCGLRFREKERAKAHLTRSHGHLRARAGGVAHEDPLITEVKPEGAVGKLQRVEPGKKGTAQAKRSSR
nr:zinc finger protein OZF-like [Rhipicephalus microplus]